MILNFLQALSSPLEGVGGGHVLGLLIFEYFLNLLL